MSENHYGFTLWPSDLFLQSKRRCLLHRSLPPSLLRCACRRAVLWLPPLRLFRYRLLSPPPAIAAPLSRIHLAPPCHRAVPSPRLLLQQVPPSVAPGSSSHPRSLTASKMDDFNGPEYELKPHHSDSNTDYEVSTPETDSDRKVDSDESDQSVGAVLDVAKEEEKEFEELVASDDFFVVYFYERKYTERDDADAAAAVTEFRKRLRLDYPIVAINNEVIESYETEPVPCFYLIKGEMRIIRVDESLGAQRVAALVRKAASCYKSKDESVVQDATGEVVRRFKELIASDCFFVVYFYASELDDDPNADAVLDELNKKLRHRYPTVAIKIQIIGLIGSFDNVSRPCFYLLKGATVIYGVDASVKMDNLVVLIKEAASDKIQKEVSVEGLKEAMNDEVRRFEELTASGEYFIVYFYARNYTKQGDADALLDEFKKKIRRTHPIIAINNEFVKPFADDVVPCFCLLKGGTCIVRLDGSLGVKNIACLIRQAAG